MLFPLIIYSLCAHSSNCRNRLLTILGIQSSAAGSRIYPSNVRLCLLLAGSERSEILIGAQDQSLRDLPRLELGLDRLCVPNIAVLRSAFAGKFRLS
jgi:hypothetical protein